MKCRENKCTSPEVDKITHQSLQLIGVLNTIYILYNNTVTATRQLSGSLFAEDNEVCQKELRLAVLGHTRLQRLVLIPGIIQNDQGRHDIGITY